MEFFVVSNEKSSYEAPKIDIVFLTDDIITESHRDPNMGEWDTDI